MTAAALVWENLVDGAVVSASSWIASAPPTLLQNAHVWNKWKGRNAATEYLTCDFGSVVEWDSLMLIGCEAIIDDDQAFMNSDAVTRVLASVADATALTGDAYDSGSAAGRIDDRYGNLVIHLPESVSSRYVRIDLSQSSATALLAGRWVMGLRDQFAYNFVPGWSYGYADNSRIQKSAGGGTFVDRQDRYRVLNIHFEVVDPEDRYGFIHDIDRVCGTSRDIMVCLDPDGSTPDRDTIWGLMRDLSPPIQPNLVMFSKSYAVDERQ